MIKRQGRNTTESELLKLGGDTVKSCTAQDNRTVLMCTAGKWPQDGTHVVQFYTTVQDG